MKNKLFILIVSAIAVTSFSSCKKDWACECNTSGQTTTHEIDNETLINARNKCKSYEGSVLGVTTTCSIK